MEGVGSSRSTFSFLFWVEILEPFVFDMVVNKCCLNHRFPLKQHTFADPGGIHGVFKDKIKSD
jgi:hypothetical protein